MNSHPDTHKKPASLALDTPPCSAFSSLFAHMSENHGLTLTDSKLADICDAVDATRHPIVSSDVIARMKSDIAWMQHLLATIRDKADIRYGNNRGLLAFSDLKALAASSLPNAIGEARADDAASNPPKTL